MNGCAPGLALIEGLKATRKWAIRGAGRGFEAWKPVSGPRVTGRIKMAETRLSGIVPGRH